MGKPGLVTVEHKQVRGPWCFPRTNGPFAAPCLEGARHVQASCAIQWGCRKAGCCPGSGRQTARRGGFFFLFLGAPVGGARWSAVPSVSHSLNTSVASSCTPPPFPSQDTFIFKVEGTGVLRPEDIVLTALEVLGRKIRNLQASAGARNAPAAPLQRC